MMNSFYSYSCPAALALNYNGTAGAASCSACACPYNNISTAAGSRCCGTNSCPYSASALSNLNCPYAAAYNTASRGCCACGNGYSGASCNTPVFLSAYASTPQCTSCSGAVIFDHLNTPCQTELKPMKAALFSPYANPAYTAFSTHFGHSFPPTALSRWRSTGLRSPEPKPVCPPGRKP